MIRELPTNAHPIVAADLTRRASVKDYLEALNTHAPGLDARWDDAVALGLGAAAAIRAGHWEAWRRAALPYLDGDDLDVLGLAAVSLLAPGVTPGPFASWIALTAHARREGLTPEAVAEHLGTYLAPLSDDDGEDA